MVISFRLYTSFLSAYIRFLSAYIRFLSPVQVDFFVDSLSPFPPPSEGSGEAIHVQCYRG
jgi:hypothetical protein